MTALDEFRATLTAIAERSAAVKHTCANEESTKHFLILPIVGALGYDYTDPFVVQPEFAADFRDNERERVDYVVMRDGTPIIAIECKKAGADLAANRGQLRAYFSALQSVRLGILTNGTLFEFFADCETPNIMDTEPFVTLDLEAATRAPIAPDVLEALSLITQSRFEPEMVAEAAGERLIAKRLRTVLTDEVRQPSEELCRLALKRVGVKNVHHASIKSRYTGLVRAAFEEALIMPVLEKLRAERAGSRDGEAEAGETSRRVITTDRELAVYRYVCRRLAYLAADEHQFAAIERVRYQDYIGKFVIYYDQIRKGRICDFIEGRDGYDKFVFPAPHGEIVTNSMRDIDEALRTVFAERVREIGAPGPAEMPIQQTA